MLKKQALLISILYTVALLVVSLITLDLGGIEAFAPSFGDKLFHFFAYSLLVYTWYFTCTCEFKMRKLRAIYMVTLCAALFGIIIEVLQKLLTNTRFFDVGDIMANGLGIMLTMFILLFNIKRDVKKY